MVSNRRGRLNGILPEFARLAVGKLSPWRHIFNVSMNETMIYFWNKKKKIVRSGAEYRNAVIL